MIETLSALLFVLGSGFIFVGGLGLLKFPTPLMRAHALSKAMLLGISLMLLALLPSLQTWAEVAKVFLAIIFLIATIPIAGHIFALFNIERPEEAE